MFMRRLIFCLLLSMSFNPTAFADFPKQQFDRFKFLLDQGGVGGNFQELERLYVYLMEASKGSSFSEVNAGLLGNFLKEKFPDVKRILLKDPTNLFFSDGSVYRRIVNLEELSQAASNRVLRLKQIAEMDSRDINAIELVNLVSDLEKLLVFRDDEGLLISAENAALLRTFLDGLVGVIESVDANLREQQTPVNEPSSKDRVVAQSGESQSEVLEKLFQEGKAYVEKAISRDRELEKRRSQELAAAEAGERQARLIAERERVERQRELARLARKAQLVCAKKSRLSDDEILRISHYYRVSISTIKYLGSQANYENTCSVTVDTPNGVKFVFFSGSGNINPDRSSGL